MKITTEDIQVGFHARQILKGISIESKDKELVGIIGPNGSGKSTLLKCIYRILKPDAGAVYLDGEELHSMSVKSSARKMAVVAQHNYYNFDFTVREVVLMGRAPHKKALERDNAKDYRIVEEALKTVQMDAFADRTFSTLSGGEQQRVILARALAQQTPALILDEPTNHLDIESIQWLENFLSTRANAVVLVSHDRAFLNNVTTRTIEITCGQIYDYKVKYDEFVVLRKERREQQLRAYENQQKQIQDTEDFIERFRYKATKAVQVQSRIKQLEKIDRIEVDEEDNSALRLKFPPASRSGNYPVICEDVRKAYGSHVVFHDVNLTINRGEKVAFVGKNGEGKSTLVKCIMDEIDFEGKLTIGHNVQIGYFAQNQAQMLDENLTVFDTIDRVATGDIRLKIRDILGAFMFGGEASDKKVKVLSGGERTRLAMIKLLLEPVNLLILDEPTNHLDMRSKDVLKEAIREFDGTVILVSHDRDFLDGLATKVYEFGGGLVKEHLGGIYEFLQKKKIDSLNELQKGAGLSASPTASAKGNEPETGQPSENKLSYEAQKELNKKIKKLERQVADCEASIEETESAIAIVEAKMATPEGASDMQLYERHQKLKQQLDGIVEEWERVSMELEEVKN